MLILIYIPHLNIERGDVMILKIKKLRKEKGITAQPLIDLLKVTPGNYYKKELGQIKFSLLEAKKVAEFFGKTIDEVFFDKAYSKME